MRKDYLLRLLAVLLGVTLIAAACGDDDGDAGDDAAADDSADDSEDTVDATQAAALGRDHAAGYVELRHLEERPGERPQSPLYVTYRRDLPEELSQSLS